MAIEINKSNKYIPLQDHIAFKLDQTFLMNVQRKKNNKFLKKNGKKIKNNRQVQCFIYKRWLTKKMYICRRWGVRRGAYPLRGCGGAQCCHMYDNYRVCTITLPSVRCAQMHNNFLKSLSADSGSSLAGGKKKSVNLTLHLNLEAFKTPVRVFSAQFQAFIYKVQAVVYFHAAYVTRFCHVGVSNKVVFLH